MQELLSHIRTDLAIESAETFSENENSLAGVSVHETSDEESHIRITHVHIKNEKGAKQLGKDVISHWKHPIWRRRMRTTTRKSRKR